MSSSSSSSEEEPAWEVVHADHPLAQGRKAGSVQYCLRCPGAKIYLGATAREKHDEWHQNHSSEDGSVSHHGDSSSAEEAVSKDKNSPQEVNTSSLILAAKLGGEPKSKREHICPFEGPATAAADSPIVKCGYFKSGCVYAGMTVHYELHAQSDHPFPCYVQRCPHKGDRGFDDRASLLKHTASHKAAKAHYKPEGTVVDVFDYLHAKKVFVRFHKDSADRFLVQFDYKRWTPKMDMGPLENLINEYQRGKFAAVPGVPQANLPSRTSRSVPSALKSTLDGNSAASSSKHKIRPAESSSEPERPAPKKKLSRSSDKGVKHFKKPVRLVDELGEPMVLDTESDSDEIVLPVVKPSASRTVDLPRLRSNAPPVTTPYQQQRQKALESLRQSRTDRFGGTTANPNPAAPRSLSLNSGSSALQPVNRLGSGTSSPMTQPSMSQASSALAGGTIGGGNGVRRSGRSGPSRSKIVKISSSSSSDDLIIEATSSRKGGRAGARKSGDGKGPVEVMDLVDSGEEEGPCGGTGAVDSES